MNKKVKFKNPAKPKKAISSGFLIICFFFIACPVISDGAISVTASSSKVDSLKTLLDNAKHDTTRINTLLALSGYYITTAPDTALIYAEQALQLANTMQWQHGIANAHHSIGHAHFVQGNFTQCLHHWNKVLEIRKQLAASPDEDIAMAARNGASASLGNIGIVYRNQGDYPKALSYYFQALEMDSVLGNKNRVAKHLGNIGLVYWNQGDYPKALSFYFQALEMDSVMGNKRGIAIRLGNIGIVYFEQGDYPKALSYFFRSLEMDSVMGDKRSIAIKLGNIGGVYDEQGDYAKALSYYFQALEMDTVMGNKNEIAIKLGNIGALYTKIKEYNKAEQYLKRSLAISDSIGALLPTMTFEKSISELYAQTKRWQKAYNHHLLFSNAKDTVFGEEKNKAIGRVEMKHELEMAEMERVRITNEKSRVTNEKIARRNLLQYSLIFFVVAIVLILIFYSKRLMAMAPEKIFSIKINKAKAGLFLIFIFIFILFETLLLLTDPYVTEYTGSAPAFILLINSFLACLLFPLHSIIETTLAKKYLVKNEITKESLSSPGMITGLLMLVMLNSFTLNEKPDTIEHSNIRTFEQLNIRTKADSLINQLTHSKEDTQKVNLLNAIAWELRLEDEKQALEYIQKGLSLAEKLHDERGKAILYGTLGSLHYNHGNYPAAIESHLKALKIDSTLSNEKGIARHLGNIGNVYRNQGNYPKALSYYFMSLEMDSVMGNKKGIGIKLGNIGSVYNVQGDYPKALSYYFQALEMDSVIGNKKNIAIWLGNIGIVYADQGDYPKALAYYFQALEMDSVMGNKSGIAIHLCNIGNVYNEQGDYPKALSYYFQGFEMDSVMGNKNGVAKYLGNIGIVYRNQGDYPKALSYYFQALEMDSVMGNKKGIALKLGNIGVLYTKIEQYDKAEQYLKRSLAISDSIGALHETMKVEKSISELYASLGQLAIGNRQLAKKSEYFKMAYDHHLLYRIAKDTVFGEEKTKAIGRVEMKHEIEMAEYLRKQEEKMVAASLAATTARRNFLQYSAIFIGFFVFLGGILLLSRLLLSRLHLPVWLIEFISFVPFLILFEFLLVLTETWLDAFTGGAPLYRLLFNGILAGLLYPVQQFSKTKMKRLFYTHTE